MQKNKKNFIKLLKREILMIKRKENIRKYGISYCIKLKKQNKELVEELNLYKRNVKSNNKSFLEQHNRFMAYRYNSQIIERNYFIAKTLLILMVLIIVAIIIK